MNEALKKLYQSVILKNNQQPFKFEKREEATYVLEAYNQLCGDRFKLFFEVADGRIIDLYFHGFGCAISKASSSILVKHLENKTLEEARAILKMFFNTVREEGVETIEASEDFQAFSAAKSFPGRAKCATLSWDTMDDFLKKV